MASIFHNFLALAGTLCIATSACAVSLAGRSTDDSVCDLSPLTSYRLGAKTFVADGTKDSDQIYERLALRFITKSCRNNQMLILDSDHGSDFDLRYFRSVASRLCPIASIQRVAYGTSENPNGFQIKCLIVKLPEAKKWLNDAEATKSTEMLISEGAPIRSGNSSSGSGASTLSRDDCSKLSFTSIFIGGGGCR